MVTRSTPRGRRTKAVVSAALVAALVPLMGCGTDGGDAAEGSGQPVRGDTPPSSPVTERGEERSGPNDDGGGFAASAESSGGEEGAANRIEDVRFQIFDGYERLLVDFGRRDGETAGVPRWSVESAPQGGHVRVRFPGLDSTAVTGKDLIGSVLTELYVVRAPDGGLFADVFATQAFRYRVTELSRSGQLAIDLRGVREGLDFPPTTGDRVVVLQPREAEEVVSPLDVRGYARSFGGPVTVSLLDRGRDVIASETVRADGRVGTWGSFETTLEFSGYEGLATLRVGGRSPRDGSLAGTETEIFLESSGPG